MENVIATIPEGGIFINWGQAGLKELDIEITFYWYFVHL